MLIRVVPRDIIRNVLPLHFKRAQYRSSGVLAEPRVVAHTQVLPTTPTRTVAWMTSSSSQDVGTKKMKGGENGPSGERTSGDTSSPSPPPSTIDLLKEVNRSLYVYRPDPKKPLPPAASHIRQAAYAPPRAVLIMGWMDAPLRIVKNYAQPYIDRFPNATIIVKLSNGKDFLADKAIQQKYMRAVVDLLEEVEKKGDLRDEMDRLEAESAGLIMSEDKREEAAKKAEENESGRDLRPKGIIWHSFSDGGGSNSVVLLKMLRGQAPLREGVEQSPSSSAVKSPEVRATIFDSSPGISTARTASNAFSMHLRRKSFFIWLITKLSVYIGIGAALWWKWLLGRKTRSDIMRSALNDSRLWSSGRSGGKEADRTLPPRMYLYSKQDELIAFEAVELHAKEAARSSGLKTVPQPEDVEGRTEDTSGSKRALEQIVLKRWTNAPHCDIGRFDKQGYWRQVDAFLDSVM